VIWQIYTRDDIRDVAEVLMDLEADDVLRAQFVQPSCPERSFIASLVACEG
jgi:hypothetical protein